jgi:hypothetical protein
MSNKSKQGHNIQIKPQNIGTIDRTVRAVIGVALLASLFIASRTTETFFGFTSEEFPYYVVALAAIYPALTAIFGWDPIYQVLRVRSETPLEGDVSGSVKEQVEAVAESLGRDKHHSHQH